MSNTVPVKRVNKLGHAVTKHVLANPAQNTMKAIIPPPAGKPSRQSSSMSRRKTASTTGEFKPTGGQKNVERTYFFLSRYPTDQRLVEALAPFDPHLSPSQRAWLSSDVQAYELLAAVDVPTAIALGCNGFDTKDKALEFLSEHGLDDLIKDNSEITDKALRRRLKFKDYCEGVRVYGDNTDDSERLLDAAIARSSSTLQKIRLSVGKPIEQRILDGDISMKEIEAIGVSAISHSNMAERVIDSLGRVHRGEVDMTADQVKEIVHKYNEEKTLSENGVAALDIAEQFGAKFVLGLNSLKSSAGMYQWLHQFKNTPKPEHVKAMLEYSDAMDHARVRPKFDAIAAMLRSGMPAGKAAELLASGYQPYQVIEMRKTGIQSNLSDGFL